MNPDLFSAQEAQYRLTNLLFGVLLIGLVLMLLYTLWQWCNRDVDNRNRKSTVNETLSMKPVYAHEIEPGVVVLQSEEGDYFKILKEYDLAAGNRYGSVSCTRPEVAQPRQDQNMQTLDYAASDSFYPTPFSRDRVQTTQIPTAPPGEFSQTGSRIPLMATTASVHSSNAGTFDTATNPPPYWGK